MDLNDVSGVPAVSMYLVVLIFLVSLSFLCLGGGLVVVRYLGKRHALWRYFGSCMAWLPVFLASVLGALLSTVYSNDGGCAFLAVTLYFLSIALLLANALSRSRY